jgi:hypothetical protein
MRGGGQAATAAIGREDPTLGCPGRWYCKGTGVVEVEREKETNVNRSRCLVAGAPVVTDGWRSGPCGTLMTMSDPYVDEQLSPTVLYDVMAEAANRLIGTYVNMCDLASGDAEEQQRIRVEMARVRQERREVDVDDREGQLRLIRRWEAERRRLDTGSR